MKSPIRCILTAADPRLTPDRIVTVARPDPRARALRFSMRKLAAALDVNPMTIYLRFENKDALLDAVAGESGRVQGPPADGTGATRCGRSPSDSGTT